MPVKFSPAKVPPGQTASAHRFHSDEALQKLAEKLAGKRFIYNRVLHDQRVLSFGPPNLIVEGIGGLERYWWLDKKDGKLVLGIGPEPHDPICELEACRDGVWRGAWNDHEKMDIQLIEVPA
jgi:hypothetical protein